MSDSIATLIRGLQTRKNRERRGLTLAEGVRLVEEVLAAGVPVTAAVTSPALEATPRGAALAAALRAKVPRCEAVEDRALAELASTEHPQGVVAVIEPRTWQLADLPAGARGVLLVLDAVQDPGNVGTMLRTAWALGADGVVALPGTAELANPKVLRGAMGASFRLPAVAAPTEAFLAWLGQHHGRLVVSAADGTPLNALGAAPGLTALVVGNEGAGCTPAVTSAATATVAIPMRAGAESLNVAVAAGILLHGLCHAR